MNQESAVYAMLPATPMRWLVTGSAGFIGSHLLEHLLQGGQHVVSLDNFSTGHRRNLEEVCSAVGDQAWARHEFIEADISDPASCQRACEGVDVVLHQAALGSVPRSIEDPPQTHAANATGFLNMLMAAKDKKVSRFVFASSSAVYGDHPGLPKVEDVVGRPLSPYAVTKFLNELYADVFTSVFDISTVGLRYFNVFGPRQDPNGPYAAVIPNWAQNMSRGQVCYINGDGETTRDFCYIDNVVQANFRAALSSLETPAREVFNVAFGERISLNELHRAMRELVGELMPELDVPAPSYRDFRKGDVRHSLADIGRIRAKLGYEPSCGVRDGLRRAMPWYLGHPAP